MKQKKRLFGKRSKITILLFLTITILVSGCKKKKEIPLIPYNQNNCTENELQPIMKTEKGYYYCNCYKRGLDFHFIDLENKSDIYLCSKPECAHDGSEFCTATNGNYYCIQSVLYGENLYSYVYELSDDNEQNYKVLSNSIDGTSLSEIATVLSYTGDSMGYTMQDGMLAHNGKLFINYYYLIVKSSSDMITKSGIAEVDIKTGNCKIIHEVETKGTTNGISRMNACGDYLYFVLKEPKNKCIVRYQISTGERQEAKLITYSSYGVYSVLDENRILFSKDRKSLEIYDFSKDERTEVPIEFRPVIQQEGKTEEYSVNSFTYYKDYIIVAEDVKASPDEGEKEVRNYHIYTMDGTEINYFQWPEEAKNIYFSDEIGFSILDGEVYIQDDEKAMMCPFEDILQGKADFKVTYTYANPRVFPKRSTYFE